MRACFAFHNAATANKPAVLSIFEDIGFWGTQAGDFIAGLNSVKASGKKDLTVEISSPGGDVAHALAMYNSLRAAGLAVTTKVMGAAASAASLVFMAGDKREMPKNTYLMLHNPSTFVAGNADDMDDAAQALRKIGGLVRQTYVSRSGMTDEELTVILSKDSFFTPEEAVANGLATAVIEDDVKVTARFDMARAAFPDHVRKAYMSADEIAAAEKAAQDAAAAAALLEHPEVAQIEVLAKAGGVEDYAGFIALSCGTVEMAKAKIETIKNVKQLCVLLKKPEAAAGYIKAGKTLDEVRAAMTTEMAEGDQETSTKQPVKKPETQGQPGMRDDNKGYWARYNANKAAAAKALHTH